MVKPNIEYQPFGTLLRRIVDNRGKTCPTADRGIPLIATNCISNSRLHPLHLKVRYVDSNTYESWFRGHPTPGDMIFVTKGTPGRVAWVPDPVGFCIAQDMVSITADESKIYPKYLFAALRSNTIQREIEGLHVGTLIPHFKKGDFNDLDIPIVHESLQRFIGDQYFNICLKIEVLYRQNEILEALAETVFKQWFVEEEDEWPVDVLGNHIEIFDSNRIPLSKLERDKMKDGECFPYYGAAGIMDHVNNFIFDGEYILMGEDGTVETEDGYPVLQFVEGKFWVNNHAHIFQAKPPFDNFYMYIFLKRTKISSIITGAVQPKINQRNMKSLEFPVPPIDKVEGFLQLSNPVCEKLKRNNEQIKTLESLRDTLLPKLISGEARVQL